MINWQEHPFFRITLLFTIGIFIADYWAEQICYVWSFCIIILLVFCLYFFTSKRALAKPYFLSTIILILFFLLGILRYATNDPLKNHHHFSYKNENENENYISGIVQEIPKVKNAIRCHLKVIHIGIQNELYRSNGKLLVYFESSDSTALYKPGDKVLIKGNIRPIRPPGNPYAFDFASYERYQKTNHQIFVKAGNHQLISKNNLSPFIQFSINCRQRLLKVLSNNILDKDQLAIASAMILGFRDNINNKLYEAYTDSGAIHVLAVSGLHVGIIFSIFYFLLNLFKTKARALIAVKTLILISIVWFYALITGSAPSVLRASLMLSIFTIGKYWFKSASGLNVLCISAFILLLIDPYMLFQVGFLLSFLALGSLIYFTPLIANLVKTKNKILTYIKNLIAVSIAAQVLIFPVLIYYFHKFSVYFVLSGLIAAPLAFLIIITGLALLFSGVFVPSLSNIFGTLLSSLIESFNEMIFAIQDLPNSTIEGIWMEKSTLCIIYCILILTMFFISTKNTKWFLGILVAILLLVVDNGIREMKMKNLLSLTIYDIHKAYLIDIFDGNQNIYFKSDDPDSQKMLYASENNRMRWGIHSSKTYSFSDSIQSDHLYYKDGFAQLGDKTFLFVGAHFKTKQKNIGHIDYLVVTNKNKIEPNEILPYISAKKVILDQSITKMTVRDWRKACKEFNIDLHQISDSGAFTLNILK